jgi:hypothetical protein
MQLRPVFEVTVRSQRIACTFLICILFLIAGSAKGFGQRTGPPGPPIRTDTGDNDDSQQRIAREAAKKANEDRQAALKNDTEKLVKLAAELKEYVEKSNSDILSLDVIKKADQIEKLAHSVKEKMKGTN